MEEDRQHLIVVADDEVDLRETIHEYLTMQGLNVLQAQDGAELREIAARETIDLVILDVRMPGEDGLSLARFLRERGDVGIVFLTAVGDMVDRVVGLELGADDYIPKPVDLRELLARVKAVLRRIRPAQAPSGGAAAGTGTPAGAAVQGGAGFAGDATPRVAFGTCSLDLDAHKLYDGGGTEIPITSMEYDLLKAFAQHPNRVLTRDQLLDLAHNRGWEPFDRSIDIRIARLRRKIEDDPAKPQVIKTVRGSGYLFSREGSGEQRGG